MPRYSCNISKFGVKHQSIKKFIIMGLTFFFKVVYPDTKHNSTTVERLVNPRTVA